jgi:hypothetical protein
LGSGGDIGYEGEKKSGNKVKEHYNAIRNVHKPYAVPPSGGLLNHAGPVRSRAIRLGFAGAPFSTEVKKRAEIRLRSFCTAIGPFRFGKSQHQKKMRRIAQQTMQNLSPADGQTLFSVFFNLNRKILAIKSQPYYLIYISRQLN